MFLDFEFRNTSEAVLDLVAGVLKPRGGVPIAARLHKDEDRKNKFKALLLKYKEEPIVCFNAIAEARGLSALGLDPLQFKWCDLMLAARMLFNKPGLMNAGGLIDVCDSMGVKYRHAGKKSEMLDLILSKDHYSKEEMDSILVYCVDDTVTLEPLAKALFTRLVQVFNVDVNTIIKKIYYLSKFSAAMGVCEGNGMPVDVDSLDNFLKHYKKAKFMFIERCSYPFYKFNHGLNDYIKSSAIITDYIISNNFYKDWPKTQTGMFCTDSETLKKKSSYSKELKELHETEKIVGQVKYFNPQKNELKNNIGSDDRVRPYFNPYGTQTGRNAPPAKQFILAMSSVFRALIKPKPGFVITGVDWSSQEFALAAALSGDKVMLSAYYSGDPYFFFCKKAGAVPQNAKKEDYKAERLLFKATTLGLQYGMGYKSLAIKLTADTGRAVSENEAKQLVNLHKTIYSQYWKWVKSLDKIIDSEKPMFSLDGWGIRTTPKYRTSLRNFPVQSAGAAVLRAAVLLSLKDNLKIIAPLHDAIYIEHREGDSEAVDKLKANMDKAVKMFFPNLNIRLDCESHGSNDTWVEDRSKEIYEMVKPFFTKDPQVTTRKWIRTEIEDGQLFSELEKARI